jgi:hypothetical protein
LFPFTMITFSARLVWLIMQCSLLFHLLAQLLKLVSCTNMSQSRCCKKACFVKGVSSSLTYFFLKWALNHRCKVPFCDIAALTAFLRTDSSRLAG